MTKQQAIEIVAEYKERHLHSIHSPDGMIAVVTLAISSRCWEPQWWPVDYRLGVLAAMMILYRDAPHD